MKHRFSADTCHKNGGVPSIFIGETDMIAGYEWIIILVIVVLVFGVGRLIKIGSELGKGISAFRAGDKEGTTDDNSEEAE